MPPFTPPAPPLCLLLLSLAPPLNRAAFHSLSHLDKLLGVFFDPIINQSINVYSFHQPYLIFQEKKAYSVATLYQNISKVTDYYISVEKISNRNCLEEELLEVLPKAKGAVASNVEGVEPGSC